MPKYSILIVGETLAHDIVEDAKKAGHFLVEELRKAGHDVHEFIVDHGANRGTVNLKTTALPAPAPVAAPEEAVYQTPAELVADLQKEGLAVSLGTDGESIIIEGDAANRAKAEQLLGISLESGSGIIPSTTPAHSDLTVYVAPTLASEPSAAPTPAPIVPESTPAPAPVPVPAAEIPAPVPTPEAKPEGDVATQAEAAAPEGAPAAAVSPVPSEEAAPAPSTPQNA